MCWRWTQQSVAWDRQFFVESEILFKLRTAMPNTIYIRPESLSFCRDYWRRPLGIDIKGIFVSLSVKEKGPCALRKRKGPSNFNRNVVVMFIQWRLLWEVGLFKVIIKFWKAFFNSLSLLKQRRELKWNAIMEASDLHHLHVLEIARTGVFWCGPSPVICCWTKHGFFCCCFIFIFVSL